MQEGSVEIAGQEQDVQSARHIIDKELFRPTGRSLDQAKDRDEGVLYVVAKDGNNIIGASRLALNPSVEETSDFWTALDQSLSLRDSKLADFKGKIALMSGTVLEPGHRGQGTGSKLYDLREVIARENKKELLVSRIRPDSWNIYKNRSYTEFGTDKLSLLNGEVVVRKWVYKII